MIGLLLQKILSGVVSDTQYFDKWTRFVRKGKKKKVALALFCIQIYKTKRTVGLANTIISSLRPLF